MQKYAGEVRSVTGLLEIHRHSLYHYFTILHPGAKRMLGGFKLRNTVSRQSANEGMNVIAFPA